jgi:hypothetical protein
VLPAKLLEQRRVLAALLLRLLHRRLHRLLLLLGALRFLEPRPPHCLLGRVALLLVLLGALVRRVEKLLVTLLLGAELLRDVLPLLTRLYPILLRDQPTIVLALGNARRPRGEVLLEARVMDVVAVRFGPTAALPGRRLVESWLVEAGGRLHER